MKNSAKKFLKLFTLFLIGGLTYCGIEVAWRGYTHWTMAIVGGICFIIVGGLNNYIPWEMAIWKQGIVGALFVTAMEFVVGIPLNLFLGLHIWDYSNLPFNLLGQICLPFTIVWFFLSLLCIFVDDWLRYILFKEEKPKYSMISKQKDETQSAEIEIQSIEQPIAVQAVEQPTKKVADESLKYIVDISYAQGKITDTQWQYFKDNLAGIIIRFGYRGYSKGALKLDKCIEYNIFKCQQYGIPYGLYFFSQAVNKQEGIEEANAVIDSDYFKNAALGIWFDSELGNNGNGRADKISVSARTEAAKGFCDTIIASGKKAGIYASSSWFKTNLNMNELPYPVWVAHYSSDYSYKKNVVLWQYSSTNQLKVPGFNNLDCNKVIDKSFFNGTSVTQNKTKKDHIRAIQSALCVTTDGIAGPKTIAATVTISKDKNYMHPVVKPVQDYLNYLGYDCGNADGIAGAKFGSAVKKFQKDHGCVVDGELTAQKNTWKKLLTV
uniref:lysozyme n=1 Tax=Siphoviridae sp. ctyvQ1 TaxID=2826525 RepID=A0A8S5R0Q3_9CAUD|nr:MAG TPA: endolysin [Siphoviridae sp. ctyvQ1]